jgi:putative FmdB family regulatory protein
LPLYEYECANCGKRFEVIQKFADEPSSVCTKCGGGPVTRLVSSPAIQFKGTGWYVTDYARKSVSDSASSADGKDKKDKKDGDKPAASTETARESKPASDTPTSSSSTKDKD